MEKKYTLIFSLIFVFGLLFIVYAANANKVIELGEIAGTGSMAFTEGKVTINDAELCFGEDDCKSAWSSFSCVTRQAASEPVTGGHATALVYCNEGEIATGGGCTNNVGYLIYSAPIGNGLGESIGWSCNHWDSSRTVISNAFAICCKFE